MHWGKKRSEFKNNYTSEVETALPEMYAPEIIMCNFQADNLKVTNRYKMILCHDILSELKIDLCLSDNTIRVNGGERKLCTSPMKYVFKINFNS